MFEHSGRNTLASMLRCGPHGFDFTMLASTATFALGSLGKSMNLGNVPGYAELQTRLMDGAIAGATSGERVSWPSRVPLAS
jgi:hypothetical protein